jgi:hypothetical protein
VKITTAVTLGAACLIASMLTGHEASAGILDDLLGYGSGNYGSYAPAQQSDPNMNYRYTVTYHGPRGAVTYQQGQPMQPANPVNTVPQARPNVRYAAAPTNVRYPSAAPQSIPAQQPARITRKKAQQYRTAARRAAPTYPAPSSAPVQSAYPQYRGQAYGAAPSYGQAPQAAYSNGYGYGTTYQQPAARSSYGNQYYAYGGWQSPSAQACTGST